MNIQPILDAISTDSVYVVAVCMIASPSGYGATKEDLLEYVNSNPESADVDKINFLVSLIESNKFQEQSHRVTELMSYLSAEELADIFANPSDEKIDTAFETVQDRAKVRNVCS